MGELSFFHFRVPNSKMKKKKIHFELRIQKMKKRSLVHKVPGEFFIEMKYIIQNYLIRKGMLDFVILDIDLVLNRCCL